MFKPFFSIALIILAIAAYFMGVKPMTLQVGTVKAELNNQKSILEKGNQIKSDERELQAKAASLTEKDRASLSGVLPDKADIVKRALDLQTIASSTGLILVGKVDGKEEAQKTEQVAGPRTSVKSYGTFTITFKMIGTYESFKKFLASLSKNRVINDVESLAFSPAEVKGLFNFDLSIKTYWLPTGAGVITTS